MLLHPVLQRSTSSGSIEGSAQRYVVGGEGPPLRSDEAQEVEELEEEVEEEVEEGGRLAIELVVLWGGDTLCISHFAAPGAVFVGDASGCDVALPAELLGAERRCVAVSTRGEVCAVLAAGARGWLMLPDGSTRPFDESAGALDGERSRLTERLLPLALGHRAHVCFASLELQIAAVPLGRRCRRALGVDASLLVSLALSVLTVGSVMAALALLTPTLGLNRDEQAQGAQLRLLRSYLVAASERAAEPARKVRQEPPRQDTKPRAHEAAAGDDEVEAAPVAAVEPTLGLDTAALPAHDPIERRAQVEAARRFGVTGMLDWSELRDPKHRFERPMGSEELAMMQRLFNPEAVYEGPGGLPLSAGIGGGGKADVIALGAVRTMDQGEGGGIDRFPRSPTQAAAHTPLASPLRQNESIISDPLAAATIRRVVDAERSALLGCHADAQRSGVAATGAMVRFTVLGNGRVDQVSATHPSLPADARSCIERVFLGLSVPNPVSRPVRVQYRVVLDT